MTQSDRREHRAVSPSDEQLAHQAADGSIKAFETLVHRFEPRLMNLLLPSLGNEHDAQDIAQQALIRAYQRLHQYNGRHRFSTWLFTIANRLAATHLRRRRPQARSLDKLDSLTDRGPGPAQEAARREQAQQLWPLARQLLGGEQYAMLWLRYGEQMSIGEIASVTGRSTVRVKVALFRSRQKLAHALQQSQAQAGVAPGRLDAPGLPH